MIYRVFLAFFMFSLASASYSEATLKEAILSSHNLFRAKHQAQPLQWDAKLASYAENYAKKCEFQHSGSPYGENLAAGYPSATRAVTAWYNEVDSYSYVWPGFSRKTGHFTQVVWRSSQKIGCAYIACNGKNGTPGKYLVCEYTPRGNVNTAEYFRKNVLRVKA